ncbi:Clp protease N-terminal domain-containing protein, partial [Nostocoides sp.]
MELKPTTKVAEILAIAQRAAQSAGNPEITPAHVALAAVEVPETTVPALLAAGGTSPEAVAAAARSEIAKLPKVSGSTSGPGFGPAVTAVLHQGDTLMKAWGDS